MHTPNRGNKMQQEEASSYLRIENLWKSFGSFQALKDISLSIPRGEFVCFLGPSGCGKTTLLRAIAGLDLQTSGSVWQAGKDISNLPPAERDFGIVFQSYALFPNLTIEKNIAFGLENTGKTRDEIIRRVTELLALVGLPDQARKYPAQLSGGQQQRVALARALAMSPGLLLLDEPLSALDAKVRVHLRHEIKDLQQQLGVTTIMVTHDQEEALVMADRIVVMNHGIVEQVGTPTEIYREPSSLFAADFIGEMNQLPAFTNDNTRQIRIGERIFATAEHQLADNTQAVATIRPEDIIPHASGNASDVSDDPVSEEHNTIDVAVEAMDFMGSFWRTRLSHTDLGSVPIVADFSINAVRRLAIATDGSMRIEIPSERLKVFPGGTA
jgi:iron(III) transport system ATP-binding protein